MTVSKHIPGPWAWERRGCNVLATVPVSGSRNSHKLAVFVRVTRGFSSEAELNATGHLLAAAPDLLAALKALMPKGWGEDDTMDYMPGIKAARLAIAKAEGRP